MQGFPWSDSHELAPAIATLIVHQRSVCFEALDLKRSDPHVLNIIMGCGASTLASPKPMRIQVRPRSSSDEALKRGEGQVKETSPEIPAALLGSPPGPSVVHVPHAGVSLGSEEKGE